MTEHPLRAGASPRSNPGSLWFRHAYCRRCGLLLPVAHTPQRGKKLATWYLSAAFDVFFNPSFSLCAGDRGRLGRHARDPETEIDGVLVNGVDLIKWNDASQIIEFKVMLRPLKAINVIHQRMAAMFSIQPVNAMTPNNAFGATVGQRGVASGRGTAIVAGRSTSSLGGTAPVGSDRLVNACEIASHVLSDVRSTIKAIPLLPGARYDDNRSMPLWGNLLGKLGAPGCHARLLVQGLPISRCRQRNG